MPIEDTGAFLSKNYTAVFRIDETTKTVIVVTVRYSPKRIFEVHCG